MSQEKRFCTSCGFKLDPTATFCNNCGTRVVTDLNPSSGTAFFL